MGTREAVIVRVAGGGRSGNMPPSAPASVPYSSSSTLSPLAPPFTVERSFPAVTNPSPLPPQSPACAISSKSAYPLPNPTCAMPYFVPSGESVWPPSSSAPPAASSKLGNLNSVFGAVEAAPYYPFYAPLRDTATDSLAKPDLKGYVGGWKGQFDVEKGIPPRGSVGSSSWMDPSRSSQMSLTSHKRGSAESFSAHEESFGSWHGAQNESSSVVGHVGPECSKWLDDSHLGIYVDSNRTLTDGSHATELDCSTMWPDSSSYFYSPESTSVVKECDPFIPSSYDRYISQLISSSRDTIVHYPAPISSSRQGYIPLNERNGSLFSNTVSKHENFIVKHVNHLQKKDDDYAVDKRHDVSMHEKAEGKEVLDKTGISGNAVWKDSVTPCSSLLVNGLSSGNSSPFGHSIDCLQYVTSGFNVATLRCCKASNSEIGSFMPDDCIETSSEIHDHLNVAVDSPCWKGASVSRVYPFGSDEILDPLAVGVTIATDDLVQGSRPSIIQSNIKQASTIVCNENGKDLSSEIPKDLSPITNLSALDLKLQDSACTGRGSNSTKVENVKETAQQHIHGEYNVLVEKIGVSEGIDKQLNQAEDIICDLSSNTGEPVPEVQNSSIDANHLSNSGNYPFRSKSCTANGKMVLSSHDTILFNELKQPVPSNASNKCSSQGQDTRGLVKAMLSLSEVLLCHDCFDNDSIEEDLKPVRKIIDNLETVILRNKKDISGSSSRTTGEALHELKASNAGLSCNKDLKNTKENRNFMRSGLNNENHDKITRKSFNSNFEESDGIAQSLTKVLRSDIMEQEEDPKMLLYKKLWMQTEAALCSLKHDVALIKLEMGSFKHQFKGKTESQTLLERLAEPNSRRFDEHLGSNCATSIQVSNPTNIQVERNHKQNILKEDEDASVIARYRILKGRREANFADADVAEDINASSSYVGTLDKGVLQTHNPKKTAAESPKDIPIGKFSGSDYRMGNGLFQNGSESAIVVPDSHLSASDGTVIQSCNPKNHVKWLFSSGSDSHSSEWEHVLNDEFLW